MRLWEKFKAWRRNETMLEGVNRGRCFERKDDSIQMKATPTLTVTAKVTRTDGTQEVYHG